VREIVSQDLVSDPLTLRVVIIGKERQLQVLAKSVQSLHDFEGVTGDHAGGSILTGPLTPTNAVAVRRHVPWLRPKPVGLKLSAGVGDRLGLATPGHALAFRNHGKGITPVFAQQSAREMDRLERSPQDVMDDATFGLVEAGWDQEIGSDADHLKTTQDIDRCLMAGFTSFTLDPGEYVRAVPATFTGDLSEVPWNSLEDDEPSLIRRYAEEELDLGHSSLKIGDAELRHAAYKYGPAVAYTVEMYRHLMARADYPIEVEVAVDETEEPTTLAEHLYLAIEMKRLGMKWVSFAPRYLDGFEKGVEFRGDIKSFADSLRDHSAIASALGPYKLSLHSGSDKFSLYALAAQATKGLLHLKTSGTSYLEALGIAATCAPSLFREIYDVSRDAYQGARSTYQVSANLEKTRLSRDVADADLNELLTEFNSRQMLHVGYGAVLTLRDLDGKCRLNDELKAMLITESARYSQALEIHIGQHLSPLRGVA
jgi:hypothetical protein